MRAGWIKRHSLTAGLAGALLLVALLVPVPTAHAQDCGAPGPDCGTPIAPPCPAPPCAGDPPDPGSDPTGVAAGADLEDDDSTAFEEFVLMLVGWIMDFTIEKTTIGFTSALENTAGSFGDALDSILGLGVTHGDTAVSAKPAWEVMGGIALVLLPATLALTALSAMRAGAASVLGYADLKEALLHWFISAGVAAASFYLIGLAHRLSLAMSQAILSGDFEAARLTYAMFGVGFLQTGALFFSTLIGQLFFTLFIFFFALTLLLSLLLALASFTALIYILTALAPVVIVLGTLPPLRWLHFLWSKALVVTFMLPAINALLLRGATVMLYNTQVGASDGFSEYLVGMFITGGLLSMLIAINYKVGEFVFGALMEVSRKAWGSTMAVVNMGMAIAGAAAGGAAASAALGQLGTTGLVKKTGSGGPKGSPSPGDLPGGDSGGSSNGGNRSARSSGAGGQRSSPAAALASDPQLQQRTAQHVQRTGQALAMGTRNRLLRGIGLGAMVAGSEAGLQAGNELDAQHRNRTILNSAERGEMPPQLKRPNFDPQGAFGMHLKDNIPEASPANADKFNARLQGAMKKSLAGRSDDAIAEAREDLFTTYRSGPMRPPEMQRAVQDWANTHDIQLHSGWQGDVNALYPEAPSALTAGQIRDTLGSTRGGEKAA